MGPAISIVIALHDGRVGETIRALARQTVDPGLVEVVLVDAYCHPGVLAEAREVAGEVSGILQSRVVELPRSGRAVSWNRGIEEASAPLLLLLADDFVAAPGLVESHLALHLERPQDHVVGIGPAVFPPDDRSAFMAWLEDSGRLLGVSFTHPDPELLPAFFYGANTSIKRSLLERVGPFDEAFPHHGWDDHEMGIRLFRAGMEVVPLPGALAVHRHRITVAERRRVMGESGESAVVMERLHPGPNPWDAVVAVPRWRLRLSVAKRALARAVRRDGASAARYWQALLDLAFAAGYRRARAARSPAGDPPVASVNRQ